MFLFRKCKENKIFTETLNKNLSKKNNKIEIQFIHKIALEEDRFNLFIKSL